MASVLRVSTKEGARWRVRVYAGRDPETGKRSYITRTFDKKRDADAEARRLESQKDLGGIVTPSKEPLGRYLRRWLRDVMKGSIRDRTWSDYSGVLRRYIEDPPEGVPHLKNVRVDRLSVEAIQGLYAALQEERQLSPRTVRSLHAVIRQGLEYAARTGAVGRNVADLVVLPKMEKREVRALSQAEAGRFLEAATRDRYCALWCVLISGGLRPAEALGLKWPDLDLDTGKIHVQRSLVRHGVRKPKTQEGTLAEPRASSWKLMPPKTSKGRRVVVLPDFAIQALRTHRVAQAEEQLLVGAEYERHGFIFATEFGRPLDESNLYHRNFRRIMAEAGLGAWEEVQVGRKVKKTVRRFRPAYRLYDLRHTAATLLLRAGVNPKVTSERLGHSSVAFTMDVYSASLPDLQEQAAEKMEAMLGA